MRANNVRFDMNNNTVLFSYPYRNSFLKCMLKISFQLLVTQYLKVCVEIETEGNRQHLHAKNVLCDEYFGRLIHKNLIKKSLNC